MANISHRKNYIILRLQKHKMLAIEKLGGACLLCGYNKSPDSLTFHHKEPSQKKFQISGNGLAKKWNKIELELEKCLLLCQNCHRELHWKEDEAVALEKEKRLQNVKIRKVPWKEFSKEEKELSAFHVSKRRREFKNVLLKRFGSSCSLCQYSNCPSAMEFHHIDPNGKDFSLSDFVGKGNEKIDKELEKCLLICANCHGEIHAEQRLDRRKEAKIKLDIYSSNLKKNLHDTKNDL